MSTNPNNAVGTNAAYGGRTSVKAFNDVLGLFTGRGILSGWATVPGSGMAVAVGGDGSTRDVAIAENNSGDRTTINNISENPIQVTIPAAPASNSRYDLVVAYVDNPPEGTSTVADNPDAAGMIVVSGTAAATPALPSDGDIRSAITVDGGSGATAYYVIIATILVASGTTDITGNMITAGVPAQIPGSSIPASSITTDKIAGGAVTSDKIDWATIDARNTTAGYLRYIGSLTAAANFNNLQDGIYMYNGYSGSGGTSTPGSAIGIFVQLGSNGVWGQSRAQILYGNGYFLTRTLNSGTWNAWQRYTGTPQ